MKYWAATGKRGEHISAGKLRGYATLDAARVAVETSAHNYGMIIEHDGQPQDGEPFYNVLQYIRGEWWALAGGWFAGYMDEENPRAMQNSANAQTWVKLREFPPETPPAKVEYFTADGERRVIYVDLDDEVDE